MIVVILLLIVVVVAIIIGINKKITSWLPQTSSVIEYGGVNNSVTIQKETDTMENSPKSFFWLNSGGLLYNEAGLWHTILGDLPPNSRWQKRYAITNALDTDNGYHPQNIFRLITKSAYRDSVERVYVLVVQDNISQSPNRNDSNGIFLISRYKDPNNLYYSGIRVDGTAVIKKKIDGVYHTLAQTPLFEGDAYDRDSHPSLLPKNQWIGLETNIKNIPPDRVIIELSIDKNNSGQWLKVLSTTDSPSGDIKPILTGGHGGLRSDFMDIEFKDFYFMASTSP
ncbi:MAG: hypothetical protein WCW46_04040 [Candidatus Paceibacterota bacterium]|jgi:hypothetical protein